MKNLELKEMFKDYAAVLTAEAAMLPLNLLWIGIVARLLGPRPFGSYLMGIAIVQFLFRGLIGWGTDTVIRFGTSELLESNNLKKTVTTRSFLLFLGAVFGILLLKLGRPLFSQWMGIAPDELYGLSLMLASMVLWDLGLSINRTVGAIPRYAASGCLRQLLLVGGACLLWLNWVPRTAATLFLMEACSYSAIGFWLMARVGSHLSLSFRLDWDAIVQVVHYAWSNVATFLTGYLVDWIDLYVIRYFLDIAAVGVYQFGYRLMSLASNGLMGVIIILFPVFMRWKTDGCPEKIRAFVEEFAPKVSWFWSTAMVLLIAVTPGLVSWLGGSAYRGAAESLSLLWAGLAFQSLSVMTTSLFSIYDALPTVMGLNILMALLNIAGDVIGVPYIGILGAAWTTALCYTVIGLLYGLCASRKFGIHLGGAWFFPWVGWIMWGLSSLTASVPVRVSLAILLMAGWMGIARVKKIQW